VDPLVIKAGSGNISFSGNIEKMPSPFKVPISSKLTSHSRLPPRAAPSHSAKAMPDSMMKPISALARRFARPSPIEREILRLFVKSLVPSRSLAA